MLIDDMDPWDTFERVALEVMTIALALLRAQPDLPEDENSINRALHRVITGAAAREWEQRSGGLLLTHPVYEARMQPDPLVAEKETWEEKRPEWQWSFRDVRRTSGSAFVEFTIECKRLGKPKASWVLNRNYVLHGIVRFVHPDWQYGRHCKSGLMVGYLQDMAPAHVLEEVNTIAKEAGIVGIEDEPVTGLPDGIMQLGHVLARAPIEPDSFHLRHLWVDLRPDAN